MSEQATIIDFISASLQSMEAAGRGILSPAEQKVSDALAEKLDREVKSMVRELERVASCQQETGNSNGEPIPPFEAFCIGIRLIGDKLLPHLVQVFRGECAKRGVPHDVFLWIIRARADAFVAYLLQIAQVHGFAFDDTLTKMSKSEQIALANLGAYLRTLMQTELEAL